MIVLSLDVLGTQHCPAYLAYRKNNGLFWFYVRSHCCRGCFSAHTLDLDLHCSFVNANSHSSHHDVVLGASTRRSPSVRALNITKTARFMNLSGPRRSMCPIHCSLCARIQLIRSNVLNVGVACLLTWGVPCDNADYSRFCAI